jgi:hypothetical protein
MSELDPVTVIERDHHDPFSAPVASAETTTETQAVDHSKRGRPAGKRNQPKVSNDVRVAVKVVTAPREVKTLLSKIVKTPDSDPLDLVAAVLRDAETVTDAIEWLVAESDKSDGMEVALDVSNLYATEPERLRSIADLLADIGAIDQVRKSDLGKSLLPCAQAIHNMKNTYAKTFAQIVEVLS